MPVPFAFPFGLFLGLQLAWFARGELSRSDEPLLVTRPFLLCVMLAAFVFAPVVGYFASLHGDWAYLYFVRSGRVPSAIDLTLVLFSAAQIPVGFALAAPWVMAKRRSRLLSVSVIVLGVVFVAGVLFNKRLGVSATFAQYHGGFGVVPIGRSPLGRGVLLSWVALVLGYAWTVHALRRRA
ncbi:MAG: hypothetical protein FWD73_00510 [Polyangiaceae bacterium]|nr:hypothetical protein [Polyangiaceae bacterium]